MNNIVNITKLNESYCIISASSTVNRCIYNKYSEYKTGYFFNPKYKRKHWDGKIYVYDLLSNVLPIGLVKNLIAYLSENGIKYILNDFDDDFFFEKIDEEWYKQEIENNMKSVDFRPYQHQDEATRICMEYKKGVLLSCTGSGKSLILYNSIRLLRKKNYKNILLVVPSIMLINQMYEDFKDYGFVDIDEEVERLGGGHKPTYEKPILISTWASLNNKKEMFFKKFDAVFIDECHQSSANVLSKVVKQCSNAVYKIGVTGTLPEGKSELLEIKSVLGEVLYELKSSDLIDMGILTKIQIANIILKYPIEFISNNRNRSYHEEVKLVESYEKRNVIIDVILEKTDKKYNTLILVNHLKHLKKIEEWFKEKHPEKTVYIINGSVKSEERDNIRVGIEEENGSIILATFATMSTGVNIPKLHNVILYSNSKSKIKVLQSIGRGLRKHKTKNKIVLYDIIDDLSYETNRGRVVKNYLLKHWEERLKYYRDQDFPYLNTKINI